MTVQVAYGAGRIPLELEAGLARWHVVRPRNEVPLEDARAGFAEACRGPIGSAPLREIVQAGDRVAIVTADGTRPVPNHLLIPWLLEELPVSAENVVVVLGTGSHRANTPGEIEAMFGAETVAKVRIVNHDAFDPERNVEVGVTGDGAKVALNREYVEADKRIAVGFIEPHFFAGFSGGPKAVAPGVVSIESIFHLHSYAMLANPRSTWGELEGNPLHEAVAEMAGLCPPDFLVNVTLNLDKGITGFYLGDYMEAHRAGCARAREHAMAPVPHAFPIVVTSNSGYPLDQNLYQSVKGMSAAKRIVERDGVVLMASECRDGVPAHGNFGAMLRDHESVEAVHAHLRGLPAPVLDQWEAQALVQILEWCEVRLFSEIDADTVRACKLVPVDDMQRALGDLVRAAGEGCPVAVLPEGPLTIPYVA